MYYQQSAEDVVNQFRTDKTSGLSHREAHNRLVRHGPNTLPAAKKSSPLLQFISQFQNILVLILLVATLLSFLLGDILDAVAIFTIVLLNATIGFIQEIQAEKTLESLRQKEVEETLVLRENTIKKIPVAEVVPGDILILEEGEKIPADARVIESFSLLVDESILTGESIPVSKEHRLITKNKLPLADQENMVFKEVKIIAGRGKAVVTATGTHTEIGKIAKVLELTESMKTPLTIELETVGKRLTYIIAIVAVAIFSINIVNDISIVESLLVSISLAVAAIPEGLPAIVTIVLSLGVKRLAQKKTIMRKLKAVETLGAVRIIATDKTGTLTQNKINAVRLLLADSSEVFIEGEGYKYKGVFYDKSRKILDPAKNKRTRDLLEAAVLSSNAVVTDNGEEVIGDTTEAALVVAAHRAQLDADNIRKTGEKVFENPFTSDRKMSSCIMKNPPTGKFRLFSKGAPEVIITRCAGLTAKQRNLLLKNAEDYAKNGLRSLAVAVKNLTQKEVKEAIDSGVIQESDFTFLGLIAMQDPLRPEISEAILKAKTAGIRTIMITGDHKETAVAIAREAGIIPKSLLRGGPMVYPGKIAHNFSRDSSDGGMREAEKIHGVLTEQDLSRLTDNELTEAVRKGVSIFARISPLGKLRIIEAIKRIPHTQVAVTGDGVNDAPALKASHIGIAMGKTGTDLTREVADMVITDDNYATIIEAVKEGRVIFANLVKFIRYLISCNISEVIVVTLGAIYRVPIPLIPIQLLWINLITDGLPALALGMDPAEKDVMKRPPRDLSQGILHKKRLGYMMIEGTIIGLSVFALFVFTLPVLSYQTAQTMTFTALGFSQLIHAFNNRSTRLSVFELGIFSNKYLVAAVAVSTLLQVAVVQSGLGNLIFKTTPLTPSFWMLVVAVSLIPFAIVEVKKQLRFRILP